MHRKQLTLEVYHVTGKGFCYRINGKNKLTEFTKSYYEAFVLGLAEILRDAATLDAPVIELPSETYYQRFRANVPKWLVRDFKKQNGAYIKNHETLKELAENLRKVSLNENAKFVFVDTQEKVEEPPKGKTIAPMNQVQYQLLKNKIEEYSEAFRRSTDLVHELQREAKNELYQAIVYTTIGMLGISVLVFLITNAVV